MSQTAVRALELAARKQGVTAEELAESAGVKLRTAQQTLRELLGDHGELGFMSRSPRPYKQPPGQSPGGQPWVYRLQKR